MLLSAIYFAFFGSADNLGYCSNCFSPALLPRVSKYTLFAKLKFWQNEEK